MCRKDEGTLATGVDVMALDALRLDWGVAIPAASAAPSVTTICSTASL